MLTSGTKPYCLDSSNAICSKLLETYLTIRFLCIGTLASTTNFILPVLSQTLHLLPSQIGQGISAGNGAGK